jgi:hypothetical protein
MQIIPRVKRNVASGSTWLGAWLIGPAKSKIASCRISSSGKVEFNGRCRFNADRGGSFTIGPVRGSRLYGVILSVSVTIVRRGVAEVRGLTSSGINSRWGPAKRSRRNPACWVGSDFRVCVR